MGKSADNKPTRQEHQQQQDVHGNASEHGHTGEGAASAMAHMISQDQKRRHEKSDERDRSQES